MDIRLIENFNSIDAGILTKCVFLLLFTLFSPYKLLYLVIINHNWKEKSLWLWFLPTQQHYSSHFPFQNNAISFLTFLYCTAASIYNQASNSKPWSCPSMWTTNISSNLVIYLIIYILCLFIIARGIKKSSMKFQNGSLKLDKTEDMAHKKANPRHLLHNLFQSIHNKWYYKYLLLYVLHS